MAFVFVANVLVLLQLSLLVCSITTVYGGRHYPPPRGPGHHPRHPHPHMPSPTYPPVMPPAHSPITPPVYPPIISSEGPPVKPPDRELVEHQAAVGVPLEQGSTPERQRRHQRRPRAEAERPGEQVGPGPGDRQVDDGHRLEPGYCGDGHGAG